ncbi:hypothetical protein DFH08DRAFT_39440 [Mycena albidolilacea]|uniref:Uncharacterized protein n=1 Tax=Mycena albidolilacea TaxID=1033008 RepID=A0AAD7AWG2_9AGAR|nr:hypothetical protein DFH08DRAFT_39366 [Mycena albidolilacea]KAJ7369149.1 hypothetical protein DFH08DRAFT_39440 [Mycena albidolilacea]
MPFWSNIRLHVARIFSQYRRASDVSSLESSQPRRESKHVVRDHEDGPSTCIHGHWYTDPSLPGLWSTDWEDWDGLRFFEHTVNGRLRVDKLFKDAFDVPGTVEPLAYFPDPPGDDSFLFTAGGRYYLWAGGRLTVHHKEFASPKEFLDLALQEGGDHKPDVDVPMRPGADLSWW